MQLGMMHLSLAVAVEMARKRGLGDLTAGGWPAGCAPSPIFLR